VQADIGLHRVADGKLALSISHDGVLSGHSLAGSGVWLRRSRGVLRGRRFRGALKKGFCGPLCLRCSDLNIRV
jgi:hypothetical protein